MSDLIDVSLGIAEDMLVWPGDPPVEIVPRIQISRGDPANVSELRLGTHTGTHVDPPVHFIEGAEGIDRVSLDILIGPAFVAHLPEARGPLGPADLDALTLPDGTSRLLLRTANSELWRRPRPIEFPDTYACLTQEGARWVVERGVRLIGVDFLSVEQRGAPGHPAHHALLGNGVVIVEGLDLGLVQPGPYTMWCLPLRILEGDGGPARVVLRPAPTSPIG
jgi:arylformamidase